MARSAWIVATVLLAAPNMSSAHSVPTHQNITLAAVNYLANFSKRAKCAVNLNTLLQVGTAAEDDGVRPIFHFTPALSVAHTSCNSIMWGFGSGSCSGLGFSFTNTHRWQDALVASKDQNGKPSNNGLLELGYVLHLLQDLTSPAHTRNDSHLNFFGIGDNDPVELITRVPTTPNVAEGLLPVSSPEGLFRQLQQYTSKNFYSKDTTFTGVGPVSVREDADYFYDALGRRIAFKSSRYKVKQLIGQAVPQDATINATIATDQFAELGPVAVEYSASFVNYFLNKTQASPQNCFVDFEEFTGGSTFTGAQPQSPVGAA